MTLAEFKSWLEGFNEALDGRAPTVDEWKKVVAKLNTTEPAKPAGPVYRAIEDTRTAPFYPNVRDWVPTKLT